MQISINFYEIDIVEFDLANGMSRGEWKWLDEMNCIHRQMAQYRVTAKRKAKKKKQTNSEICYGRITRRNVILFTLIFTRLPTNSKIKLHLFFFIVSISKIN